MKTFKELIEEKHLLHKKAYDKHINNIPSIDKFNKNFDDLGDIESHKIIHVHSPNNRFLIYKGNSAVGQINYENTGNGKRINLSILHSSHQGKGLMSKIYKHIIDKGHDLIPGEHQTKGGESIWKKLKNINEVFGTEKHNDKLHLYTDEEIPSSLTKGEALSNDEREAITNYSGHAHRVINATHRGTMNKMASLGEIDSPATRAFAERHTKHIDAALNKHRTTDEIHTWRGVLPNALKDLGINPEHTGEHPIIHDKGFVSTSLKPDMAKGFSSTIGQHEHVMHIKIPTGSKALYLNHHNASLNRHEHEVLLPRNSRFKYEGSEKHNVATRYHQGTMTVHHLTHIPEES